MAIVAGSLIFRPNRCVRIGRSCGRALYIVKIDRKSPVSPWLKHNRPLGLQVLVELHTVPCVRKQPPKCRLCTVRAAGGEGGAQM
jgi:hypothetical protein